MLRGTQLTHPPRAPTPSPSQRGLWGRQHPAVSKDAGDPPSLRWLPQASLQPDWTDGRGPKVFRASQPARVQGWGPLSSTVACPTPSFPIPQTGGVPGASLEVSKVSKALSIPQSPPQALSSEQLPCHLHRGSCLPPPDLEGPFQLAGGSRLGTVPQLRRWCLGEEPLCPHSLRAEAPPLGPVWSQTPTQPCSLSQGPVGLGGGREGAGRAAAS